MKWICVLLISVSLHADEKLFAPWFTGSLLSGAGRTQAPRTTNWEPYLFVTNNNGTYSHRWKPRKKSQSFTLSPSLSVTHGLTNHLDVQAVIPLAWNKKQGQSSFRFEDITLILGIQALEDDPDTWRPDLRITLQEGVPTGHYQKFNPAKKGTDHTGSGSFETGVGLNFQKLFVISGRHYLRPRLNLTWIVPAPVHVKGFNAYGGGYGTSGKVYPGQIFNPILSFEYTFTQKWVAAIDIQYVYGFKDRFSGNRGKNKDGTKASMGNSTLVQFSLAPALEYNFSEALGIIAGVWFTVYGKDSSDFVSGVIAINYSN